MNNSFSKQHTSRLDAPENVIRSKYSRLTKVNIPPTNNFNQYRYKETSRLIILNQRYEGELQVIKQICLIIRRLIM